MTTGKQRRPRAQRNADDPHDALSGQNETERATNAVLACGARVVRLTMRDGRVLVSHCPVPFDGGAIVVFHAFGEPRARRIYPDRVQLADVHGFTRHADFVATVGAQRRGDVSGRAVPRLVLNFAEPRP